MTTNTALSIGAHSIRRDGDMWCITDLWRAAGAPKDKRPAEYLRYDGAAFVEFLRSSLDVPIGHIVKTRRIGGAAPGGESWAHFRRAPIQLRLVA